MSLPDFASSTVGRSSSSSRGMLEPVRPDPAAGRVRRAVAAGRPESIHSAGMRWDGREGMRTMNLGEGIPFQIEPPEVGSFGHRPTKTMNGAP